MIERFAVPPNLPSADVLHGTLDPLILKTLSQEALHGSAGAPDPLPSRSCLTRPRVARHVRDPVGYPGFMQRASGKLGTRSERRH